MDVTIYRHHNSDDESEGKQHHPWCNFGRSGPCKMCDKLYESYPWKEGNNTGELIKKYFPDVIKRV